jgi:hypothetical protein
LLHTSADVDIPHQRWYLPKLLFWLSFSLEDTARREVN